MLQLFLMIFSRIFFSVIKRTCHVRHNLREAQLELLNMRRDTFQLKNCAFCPRDTFKAPLSDINYS